MKKLTISIAAYNAAGTLKKCLDSMIKSRYLQEIEILIVNDGSTDKTIEIAYEYEKKYPNSIKIINKKNGGHGSTINSAIAEATGQYFKTVDADDWVESENLDILIENLPRGADLIINPYYEVNARDYSKKERRVYDETKVNTGYIYDFKDCVLDIVIAMHAMTIKTSILKRLNMKIDEKCFYVDMEYILFPLTSIENVMFLKEPVYNYLLGTSTQSMNLDVFIQRRSQHERVLLRLFEYYDSLNDKEDNRAKAIKVRITAATYIQYRIILILPPKESVNEMIEFDKMVPDEIFKDISGRTKVLLRIFKRIKFKGYVNIISWLQKIKIIKRDKSIL